MTKTEIIQHLLGNKYWNLPRTEGFAFAPTNIALVKYWGKRDTELNLPFNSSLSVSLAHKGVFTAVSIHTESVDRFLVNREPIELNSTFATRLTKYLDLFRGQNKYHFKVETDINLPIAAGLASSACGFAAVIQALDHLFDWRLSKKGLSILARLGSGSACRSLWNGFVEWQIGVNNDGTDSHGNPLEQIWPELCVGICLIETNAKAISSTEAMQHTVKTSTLYSTWVKQAEADFLQIKIAIAERNFDLFGEILEKNALCMHATMANANPPIYYSSEKTLAMRSLVWKLRQSGIPIYFTQDAGANLKLLFLTKHTADVLQVFPELEIITPFSSQSNQYVVLVDKNDKYIGIEEKLLAHKSGKLHRAFSVFVLRKNGNSFDILLQQRALDKYHCGGLWSNTCCSHPNFDINIVCAATKRLQEEMGIVTNLQIIGKFQYQAHLTNDLIENELDYVLIGESTVLECAVNSEEVQAYKWIQMQDLQEDLYKNPSKYTPWLAQALEIVEKYLSVQASLHSS